MTIVLFGGTTEGSTMARRLAEVPVRCVVCVATDYGREALPPLPADWTVCAGRLDQPAMHALFQREGADLVIDATHPHAALATQNIRAAAAAANVRCIRLLRPLAAAGACRHAGSVAEAVEQLAGTTGNVLATTGVKELNCYMALDDAAQRVYARILPGVESAAAYAQTGLPHSHCIAMQGPFGAELNTALLRRWNIRWLVTKESGAAGGLEEKLRAAHEAGAEVIVVGRPPDAAGSSDMDAVLAEVRAMLEAKACGL